MSRRCIGWNFTFVKPATSTQPQAGHHFDDSETIEFPAFGVSFRFPKPEDAPKFMHVDVGVLWCRAPNHHASSNENEPSTPRIQDRNFFQLLMLTVPSDIKDQKRCAMEHDIVLDIPKAEWNGSTETLLGDEDEASVKTRQGGYGIFRTIKKGLFRGLRMR